MQQTTANLLGSEGREAGPLKTLIFKPQTGISGIYRAISRLGVGYQRTAWRHDGFGALLIPAPEILADEPRQVTEGR